ncbi:phage tail tape measure protein [Providencia hangzhouensis]|uniref:phage tail tape measure protein n=1 Tax=Providencia hangzhouensis TaxID=3031799 RepID=UPI0034DD649B
MSEQTSRLAIIIDSSKARQTTDTLASSLERLTREGENATASTDSLGFSFKRLAASTAGAMSIASVIKLVDDWGQVAAQVKNTLKSVEGDISNYANIQQRFLDISNRNGKSIEITQQLYIGAAKSMQELGYSTQQTIDYVESFSSAFTANATSAMAVESANNALIKSMITGTVAGDNWNAIMRAAPTLLGDIARELERTNGGIKVTENEVKKMGAESKISFKLLADATQHAKDANNALADSMDNTVADGFTRVTNSAKAYYGELNQSLGITRAISAGLATVSDNFDSVSTVLTGIVGIGAARYFGNLSNSIYDTTKRSASAVLTNQRLANEQVNLSKATLAQIRNDKAAALAAIESTKAQQAAATTEVQRISLKTQLANQTANLTALTHAERLATDELTAAKARLTSASSLAKSALSLIGGPAGAAMLAGGAIYYFYQKSQQAREEALAFADSIKELRDSFDEMTAGALRGSIAKAYESIVEQQKEIGILKADLMGLRDSYKLVSNDGDKLAEVQRKIDKKTQELEAKTKALEQTMKFAADAQEYLNSKLNNADEAFQLAAKNTRSYANALGAAINFMNATADAKRNLDVEMMTTPTPEEAYGGKDAAQYIKDMEKRAEIAAKGDRDRAVAQARYYAERQGYIGDTIDRAGELAGIEFDAQQKRQQDLKDSKAAGSYSESAAQKLIGSLKEQHAVLRLQSKTNDKLGSQEQARAKFLDEIEQIKGKKRLTADQKSLLANEALINAEFDKNVQLEQYIKNREAEVKIAAYNKQLMEETSQAQRAYNMELQGAGMGTLARGRLQEELRLKDAYLKKQEELTKQFNDKSTGITQEQYDKETQVIKDELGKRLDMMRVHQAQIDGLRFNWQNGIEEGLRNYVDNARNYSQQAEGFVTSSLQNITDGSASALTDIVTNSKNAFDAISDFFGDLAKSIINDLIRIAIQAQITNAVSGLFGGGIFGGSSSSANAFSTGAYGNLSLTGMAHSGIDRVPKTGTWLLEEGERVMTQDTSARLDNVLDALTRSTSPDVFAMKYLHPSSQTNNTTNNTNAENSTEQSATYIINQTVQVYGNGEKALAEVVKVAANRGAKAAVAEIQRDFATNGKTRKLLEQ